MAIVSVEKTSLYSFLRFKHAKLSIVYMPLNPEVEVLTIYVQLWLSRWLKELMLLLDFSKERNVTVYLTVTPVLAVKSSDPVRGGNLSHLSSQTAGI